MRRYSAGTMDVMPTLSDLERDEARERRRVLLAALAKTSTTQSELARKLNLAGERTAVTTVNRWCRGKATMSAATLRYVLSILSLDPMWRPPADWQPPASPQ
ncbi:MAG: XRE family transcriptional regulator [Caulobacteraceae bacterium]|nr:XRE family transcriptional regulator [Caulobacteraceae bacterium]